MAVRNTHGTHLMILMVIISHPATPYYLKGDLNGQAALRLQHPDPLIPRLYFLHMEKEKSLQSATRMVPSITEMPSVSLQVTF